MTLIGCTTGTDLALPPTPHLSLSLPPFLSSGASKLTTIIRQKAWSLGCLVRGLYWPANATWVESHSRTPHSFFYLKVKLPCPSSGIWDALLGPPDPRRHPHCSQGISSTPARLQSPSLTSQSSLKVLSGWVLHTRRALISLSHFLEILALGLGSLSSLETRSSRTVGPRWQRCPSQVSHL
jgi:hypothetical protein